MKFVLAQYSRKLDEIERYVEYIEGIRNKTLTIPSLRSTLGYESYLKKYEVNSFVISLYGAFEEFMEDLIESFIIEYGRIHPSFDCFSSDFRERYKQLVIKHIAEERLLRRRITINEALKSLNSNFIENSPQLNSTVFRLHTRNFVVEEIDKLWATLFPFKMSTLVRKQDVFFDFHREKGVKNIESISNDVLFSVLMRTVIDRNEIAHSAKEITIYDQYEMKEMIKFFRALSSAAVFGLQKYLNILSLIYTKTIANQIDIYGLHDRNKLALCTAKSIELAIGDSFIEIPRHNLYKMTLKDFLYSALDYKILKIQSIQINKTQFKKVSIGKIPKNLGLKFDIPLNPKSSIFVKITGEL